MPKEDAELNYKLRTTRSSQELAKTLEYIISNNYMEKQYVEKGAVIINDLKQFPHIGEENSEKYHFSHRGLECSLGRSHMMTWCGYVRYSHKIHYDNINVEVHGGLTYGDGEKIGFDCAHMRDIMPRSFFIPVLCDIEKDEYRDYYYVRGELEKLAGQLANLN